MITRIAAKNYRSLKHISRSIKPFQILVGPNASGKTTFLDVVEFMSDVLNKGVDEAIRSRTESYWDLTFARKHGPIELAIECAIPDDVRKRLNGQGVFDTIRYELQLNYEEGEGHEIRGERVLLLKADTIEHPVQDYSLFPEALDEEKVFDRPLRKMKADKDYKLIVSKTPGGSDTFKEERTYEKKKRWVHSFKLGPKRSALGNLPEDETKFPITTWFKSFLGSNVQHLLLNSEKLRKLSPPGNEGLYLPDGSNLPWVVAELEKKDTPAFIRWQKHVRTALPDLMAISVGERPDIRHKFLWLHYTNNIEVPSWMASDGTLRLLALTLIPYLPNFTGTYMIEEPENGIHPKAMETVFQSLRSDYDAQIMVASHSPVVLGLAEPKDLLCFAKSADGVTNIVQGDEHPQLQEWKQGMDLSLIFASGILG
jgi:predicted ATPase